MKRRFLSTLLALGLVGGLFAGLVTTGSADNHEDYEDWASAIFFPSVHDGAMVGSTGPWYSNVTVQNIEESRVFVEFSSYTTGDVHRTAYLQPYASTTFNASQVLDGATSGPVVATAYWAPQNADNAPCFTETVETTQTVTRSTLQADSFQAEGTVDASSVKVTQPAGLTEGENADYTTSVTGDDTINIFWENPGAIATGATYEVTYDYEVLECEREPAIGGYAKQSAETPMSGISRTSSDHYSVDGYTAIPLADVAWGPSTEFSNFGLSLLGIPIGAVTGMNWDGHSYLPIIQNNTGWDSIINVSNIDGSDTSDNASVTVRTYKTGGPGQNGQSDGSYQFNLARGETEQVSLADLGVTDPEYTGGVWIESNYGVVATVERFKPETDMMMINESAPSLFAYNVEGTGVGEGGPPFTIGAGNIETYEAHAPLVFSGYHGWNSGFSVVNIAEITNTVFLEIKDESGTTVFSDQLTIDPKSQKFVYMPNTTDLSNGGPQFVGSALFSSVLPFHASVDQVKYGTGEAMSYIATQAGAFPDCNFIWGEGVQGVSPTEGHIGCDIPSDAQGFGDISPLSKLAFPLIQKGNNGGGDTSGIQLFNGSSVGNAHARVWFFSGSGASAPPTTNYGLGLPVNLGPRENATVYTLSLSGMDTNTSLSAIAALEEGYQTGLGYRGVLYGVTNNVNYDVMGDGSTAFNAVNAYGQFRTWSGPYWDTAIVNGFD